MDGTGLRDWVLGALGTLFFIILSIRALTHWGKREWGEMIGLFGTGAIVATVLFFPDESLTVLKWVAGLVIGMFSNA